MGFNVEYTDGRSEGVRQPLNSCALVAAYVMAELLRAGDLFDTVDVSRACNEQHLFSCINGAMTAMDPSHTPITSAGLRAVDNHGRPCGRTINQAQTCAVAWYLAGRPQARVVPFNATYFVHDAVTYIVNTAYDAIRRCAVTDPLAKMDAPIVFLGEGNVVTEREPVRHAIVVAFHIALP